ncbi:5-oxoprolinase subunit PxpA [Oceanobacillus sp. FSL W7-1281]|uniref:5-oxoprolinase subunit PxpA n=2 Tax=Bacillaceae TaxID=186817 RepID=UPI0030D9E71C
MMKQRSIDLNSDLGESFGAYTIGLDNEILEVVTSANIACGFHAGDYNVMGKTVKMAKEKQVGIGAHPGLPDLIGFGRRAIQVDPDEVFHLTAYQIGALKAFCNIYEVPMQHVKPHGALFNMAAKDREIAEAIAKATAQVDEELILFGSSGSELIRAGKKYGLKTASEVFADRTYQSDGSLTARTEKNAMITEVEKAIEQVRSMVFEGKVTSVDGEEVQVEADTICVHGDGQHALLFAKELRQRLEQEGIRMKRVGE